MQTDLMQGSPFDDHETVQENIKKLQEELTQPDNELNKLHVRVFNTEDGKKLLEYYAKNTIEQPTFIPQLGFDNGASIGFHRDGQNSIVREMTLRVKKGLEIL